MIYANGRWILARRTKSGLLYGPTHEAFRSVKGNYLIGNEELFLAFGYHYSTKPAAEKRARSFYGKIPKAA